MPISSYLAYPKPEKGRSLSDTLSALDGCEVTPNDDYSLLVLVTDTPDEMAEATLQRFLRFIPDLDGLALVFAHGEGEPVA